MNLAYDLFLLTFNLSQLHNKEKIIQLFVEGLQEIFKPVVFVFSENTVENQGECFEMKSRQNHFGYITIQSQTILIKEHIMLICNAIQMVAVIIDNFDYGARLEVEKERLHKYADLKLKELNHTVKDLEGARSASINLIEDLTNEIEKRKLAEADLEQSELALRESEEKFRRVFEDGTISMAIVSQDFRFIDTNEAFCRFIGYSVKELSSMTFRDFTHPEHVSADMESLKKLVAGLIPYYHTEKKYITKDGKIVWGSVHISAIRDPEKMFLYFLAMIDDITDRKKTEANLKETQLILKATLESPVDMIIIAIDLNFNYLSFNNNHKTVMKSAYGFDIEPGMNLIECMVGEDDIKNAKENYGRAMKGESLVTVQEYGDIERSFYESFYNPIRNEKGEIVGATAYARDITERKKAELALKESEAKFRNLFEHSPMGKSITGIDGSINVNRAFCRMLGYSEAELKMKNWKAVSHQADIEMTDKIIKSLISGESESARFEKRYLHKNGNTIFTDVASYLQHDNNGKPEYFITSINDITDRKLAEEKLIASEERYSLIISASEQGIWDWNIETNEVFFSKQWKRQIGYEDNEIENNFDSWIDLLHPDEKDSCLLAVQSYLNNPGEHFILEFRFRHKDGSYRLIHNKSASVKSEEGKVIRMFGTHTDITERKKAEEEIIKLNETLEQRVVERTVQLQAANKELEAFSYSVSHDLRAPLRAIHSFTSILREDYKDTLDDEGRRICGIIETSSVHMGQLIDDLLAFSRIGRTELKFSKIDMTRLVKSVCTETLDEINKERISLDIRKLSSAYGDLSAIRQVFVNLVSNAVKYSSKTEKPSILIGCDKIGDEIVYFVKDNGVGFDMQYVNKLFGVFQRLHSAQEFEGNGVGLAIVQRIIYRHGGKVWAEGEVGKGATFYFTLPGKEAVGKRSLMVIQ